MLRASIAFLLGGGILASSAHAAILYNTDFDSAPIVAPGVSVSIGPAGALEEALPGFGSWSGNYFANRSEGDPAMVSSILFTGLPAHTTISFQGILGFLESWDSVDGTLTPDYLQISIDGQPILSALTSANASGSIVNYGGGTLVHGAVQSNTNFFFTDDLVDLSTATALAQIPHTSSSLLLEIGAYGAGWQGGSDEAWGIDDVMISYTPASTAVPGPLPLLGTGSALALSRRLRSRVRRRPL